MRIVALADSDSYLKWVASLVAVLPGDWERELVVVETPVMPSAAQRAAALSQSGIDPDCVARVRLDALADRLATVRPDVVIVGTRGPVARVLIRTVAQLDPRPVIVSGLPGISIPATRKALMFRLQADLFVVHSKREVREFGALSRSHGWDHRFALATLPFIERAAAGGTDLVFAAQAVVPLELDDRRRVARLLRDAALAEPDRNVIVKVRALRGERQTHDEVHGYPELLAEFGRVPDNLRVSSQPMSAALDSAEGLVTVSSTAAIEAIARGIPVVALDTFGVSDALINPVFEGSGLFAGESAVIAREFRIPKPEWFEDNYFHDPDEDDLVAQVVRLVDERRAHRLPARATEVRMGGRLRVAWERRRAFGRDDHTLSGWIALAIGLPLRALAIGAQRTRRRLAGSRSDMLV